MKGGDYNKGIIMRDYNEGREIIQYMNERKRRPEWSLPL
jgi:hypothetical protein